MLDKIEAINQRIEEVEKKRFMNNMCDHWSNENYRIDNECYKELTKLKADLEALKAEMK